MNLTLYSRPGCHLCERLLDDLTPLLPHRARVEIVDISDEPELMRRYGLRIPVLRGGTEEISGYPLNVENLNRFFAAHND